MLEINEIFGPTIQGEGKFCGNISMFIRFGKCNFRCVGFGVEYETPSGIKKYSCDSYHAVDTAFRKEWQQFTRYEAIIEEVDRQFAASNLAIKPDIVLTGGEPLLYWHEEEFQKLLSYFIRNDYRVTIETNGSLDITLNEAYQKQIIFSVSVKLSNSGERELKRINYQTLNTIFGANQISYLKFVVDAINLKNCETEIDDIVSNLATNEIYLMPKGDTSEELDKNAQACVGLALKKGYKYTDRLHIRIWGNKRGV